MYSCIKNPADCLGLPDEKNKLVRMKIETLCEGNGKKLLLFFNGWAVPASAVAHLEADPETTVVAISDYTRLELLPAALSAFSEIRLVAWSTGVWAAGQLCRGWRFVSATAINGTPYPADDRRGIPAALFRKTWEYLSEDNLNRFYRRVCGAEKIYGSWRHNLPTVDSGLTGRAAAGSENPVAGLRNELRRIGEQAAASQADTDAFPWDRAVLSNDDRIFPFPAMLAYWQSRYCPVVRLHAPHYPFHLWTTWDEAVAGTKPELHRSTVRWKKNRDETAPGTRPDYPAGHCPAEKKKEETVAGTKPEAFRKANEVLFSEDETVAGAGPEAAEEIRRKARIRERFGRALGTYDRHAVAQRRIHARLGGMLASAGRTYFPRLLEIGCGTGGFTRALQAAVGAGEWLVNDLYETCPDPVQTVLTGQKWRYLGGDAEQIAFPGRFDLIVSASVLQWFAEPAAFVRRIAGRLNPGGLLLLNTFGPGNLAEIRQLTGHGLSYPDPGEVAEWVPCGCRVVGLETETFRLVFPGAMAVLRHLQHTGVTAAGSGVWTKGRLERFCRDYAARFSTQAGVTLTYQPIYLLASNA